MKLVSNADETTAPAVEPEELEQGVRCSACRATIPLGMQACSSCGISFGPLRESVAQKVTEMKYTTLQIVTVSRGVRCVDNVLRRKRREYQTRAVKLGYALVEDRWKKDAVFKDQMARQGWDDVSIKKIDEGAA